MRVLTLCVLSTCSTFATALSSFPTIGDVKKAIEKEGRDGWKTVSCSYGSLPSAFSEPEDLWKDSKAESAWLDAMTVWNKNESHKQYPFTTWLADYFHAAPGFPCENLGTGKCMTPMPCGQGDFPNADVNSPAGYVILNSIVYMHGWYEAYYNGMDKTWSLMAGDIAVFDRTFSPLIDPMKDQKILLDIIGMLVATLNAGIFNIWFRKMEAITKKVSSDVLSQTKDTIAASVAGGIAIARDSLSAKDKFQKAANAEAYLKEVIESMFTAWTNNTATTFSDPSRIYESIKGGAMWDPSNVTSAEDVRPVMEHTSYASMVPYAWATTNSLKGAIFLATHDNVDKIKDKTGCEAWDPNLANKNSDWSAYEWGKWGRVLFPDDVLQSSRTCDGEDAYWLVQIEEEPMANTRGPVIANILPLPGWDTLDGKKWGGLKPEDIALNIVRSWKANEKKNGWGQPTLEEIITLEGDLPLGLINFPVCSFMEAAKNIIHKKEPQNIDNPNWPCNK